MGIFDRFTKREAAPVESASEAVSDAESLARLAESNSVVAAEVESFEAKVADLKKQAEMGGGMVADDWGLIRSYAVQSAEALSGYGIAVDVEAFVELA